VIRSIGPNLVVALLLDGPQLVTRWPSRYATILTEDPGSSVLTLSAKGMVDRSKPSGVPKSNVVALWKDSEYGFKELCLQDDKDAILLSLKCVKNTEYTSDGRDDHGTSKVLVYKHHIEISSEDI
jgi:hypothetical protein